ncbi:MAG: hypothetical protein KKD90_05230, partial [Candidatus Omnitrophica bacterium]|nr:hypothetical protein [Candidatus Omnitrophota bacterium]
ELDLVFQKKGGLYGIEVKYSHAPSVTLSMRSAIAELSLKHLWVVYPGSEAYKLDKNISVTPLKDIYKQMILGA